MKAIIIPYAYMSKCLWARNVFPDRSIASLPIADKCLIYYQLDECAKRGVKDVLILDWGFDAVLADKLGDGSRWGLNLTYTGVSSGGTLKSQVMRHSEFLDDEKIEFFLDNEVGGHSIDSLEAYYKANMEVLANPGGLTLPGYSSEEGVHAGMNVVMKPGVEVEHPVLLGDNCRLERGVRVSASTIGYGAVVDEGTRIYRSVVFPSTYIGRDLDLDGKIVVGNRVINPMTAVYIDSDDQGVASSLDAHFMAVPKPVPYEELAPLHYTANGDADVDHKVAFALSELALDIASLRLDKVVAVVLGGGYGRGEGGAPLNNDLDFFVLTDRANEDEKGKIKVLLETAAIRYHDELGVDVDFCRPKNVQEFKKDERRLMMQELIRGHVVIYGDESSLSFLRPRPPTDLPPTEALRLLVNRGMGLALARYSRDRGFVKRNINKAILGVGDAILIAEGRYAWDCRARMRLLGREDYTKAVEFKFDPRKDFVPSWEAGYAVWREGADRVCELCGPALTRRGVRHALRWLARRRTLGDLSTFGCDPLWRIFVPLERLLAIGRAGPRIPDSLVHDWMTFN